MSLATRATRYLDSRGIAYRLMPYEHKEKGAEFAAKALGFPLERTIKTLVVEVASKGYFFALMPGHLQLDLKALAKALGAKKAKMADPKTAEKLTGYLTGGISPFGAKKPLPVVMDQSLVEHKKVLINGGQRGLLLLMDPNDIRIVTKARVSVIAKNKDHGGE